MKSKLIPSALWAGIVLALAIAGTAAVGPPRKHSVVVLQACTSQEMTQSGPNTYSAVTRFRMQATDASAGTPIQPVGWTYTNGVYTAYGDLPFADTLAMFLDHNYKIVAGNAFANQAYDPICIVLVRD